MSVVLLASVAAALGATARGEEESPPVIRLGLSGVVDPFTADYIATGIDAAESADSAAVIITIDTPGGLDSSMRSIIAGILRTRIPVICYTGPAGARAASAGTFIMLACPLNAMAPGTNIGAAHPVGVSGAIEQEKVTNDASAFIRALAQRWDRNADWAEQAVRDSVSVSSDEALQLGVVDLLAPSEGELLREVDGRTVEVGSGASVTLRTAGATIEPKRMGLGAAILHNLIDPNVAFLFFFLGLALVVIELLHPGVSIPGVLGTLMLVGAFVSFGFLPVRLGGVVLLLASAVFFLLELKHPGIGLPTVGGVATLVLGGLLLFNPAVPNARVSPGLIAGVAAGLVLFFGIVVSAALRARRLPPAAGQEAIVGEEGLALGDLDPEGQVRVHHETWSAASEAGPITAGAAVRVVRLEGLRVFVVPVAMAPPSADPDPGKTEAKEAGSPDPASRGGGVP
jgi:membrane-bound serine protease (ClpP class)